ncbi:Branched-chain amino acid transport protein [Terribacillus aidingensis]|uniref:Branched-chain amino acid transport protein n=1 Tax=Terribacillus aidingensis TaxID=586416 RepID=A0A285N6W5_9BACI|nr:AzlD domain-containing protein [Terribacillus aidingensis]SNZ03716.1 Branched-chain amino acid transport protein [Terribacillus aidingensis]
MSISLPMLLLIAACAAVTALPRILPFLIIRNLKLPVSVMKWLSYIPICILTALVVSNIIEEGNPISLDWQTITVMIPTLLVALWTKSLLLTVLFGVVLMAVLRFILVLV